MTLIACASVPVGDAARGREVFVSREAGHCVLCHTAPGIDSAGNVGPPLAGVGSRLTANEIRLRVSDMSKVNPDALMPAFHRTHDLRRVASQYAGKTVLTDAQLDDVVAYLATLK
jgi:sulfur-oxidizing protein SoxX